MRRASETPSPIASFFIITNLDLRLMFSPGGKTSEKLGLEDACQPPRVGSNSAVCNTFVYSAPSLEGVSYRVSFRKGPWVSSCYASEILRCTHDSVRRRPGRSRAVECAFRSLNNLLHALLRTQTSPISSAWCCVAQNVRVRLTRALRTCAYSCLITLNIPFEQAAENLRRIMLGHARKLPAGRAGHPVTRRCAGSATRCAALVRAS
jgi:hypothetical protein